MGTVDWAEIRELLLASRYLRTRFIALASIVSVMLGVATMIVVNSVMAGFTHEMQDRIHGILADIVIETVGEATFEVPPDLPLGWHTLSARAGSVSGSCSLVIVPDSTRSSRSGR